MLTAFVLPGLGHLYLGFRAKGIALVLAVNLVLLGALFFIMKIASPILAAQITGEHLHVGSYLDGLGPYGVWSKLVLVFFLCLWGFALVDIVRSPVQGGDC